MKTKIASILFSIFILFGCISNLRGLAQAFSENDYQKENSKAKEIYHNFQNCRATIDSYYTNNIKNKTAYIDLCGLALRLCGIRVVDDAEYRVVKLDDGHLSFVIPEKADISYPIAQTKKLADYLKEREIPFLYVQAPYKVCKENPALPAGVIDYSNEIADEFVEEMRNYGIDTIDLRERIHEQGIEHHSLFYKTDHHWTPEAGIWATGEIAEELHKKYGFTVNEKSIDINDYSCKIYNNWMLGSLGRRTGIGYAGVEDFRLYLPKDTTPMKYIIRDNNRTINIDFSKESFDPYFLEKNYHNRSTYCCYTAGDYTHTELYNEADQTGQSLMLIRESFGTVVSPFLGLSCERLDTVDLRYEGSQAKPFIDEMEPDYVVLMYNPNTLTSNKAFDFILDE